MRDISIMSSRVVPNPKGGVGDNQPFCLTKGVVMERYFFISPRVTIDRNEISFISVEDCSERYVDSDDDVSYLNITSKSGESFLLTIPTMSAKENYASVSQWLWKGYLHDFEVTERGDLV